MNNTIRLLFAGDFIPPESKENIYSKELKEVLKDKDFSVVNLETPLTNNQSRIEKTGKNFKRSPTAIKHIKDGKFDAIALSNNHICDFGNKGVFDTLKTCEENNIKTVGAGKNINEAARSLQLIIKGKKISILNYSEQEFNIATETKAGANPYDTIKAYYEIQKEIKENDYVIVIYHGGLEHQYYPTPEMVKYFKFMVDVGADAVISHHMHRYSGTIVYKGKPLVFGLGNFLSPTKNKKKDNWVIGIIAILSFEAKNIGLELVPTKMSLNHREVGLADETLAKMVENHIIDISRTICDKTKFKNYWLKEDNNQKTRIFRLLKSNSQLEYKIRKYIPLLFSTHISKYKKLLLLNMTRCDAHRNRIIRIFEKNY